LISGRRIGQGTLTFSNLDKYKVDLVDGKLTVSDRYVQFMATCMKTIEYLKVLK